ncbi:metallophosphoesterase [Candidatus Woesearchaeota archaeon]|nr:metallophosphoesterase [Candidatus Woesearchaeota archaeon]
MKFLVFTDLHEDKKGLKELAKRASQNDIDFVIATGDISNFGRGLRNVFETMNKVGKKFYAIPGNHEEGSDAMEQFAGEFEHCFNLHKRAVIIEDYVFLGYGGGGFAMEDAEFRKIARNWYGKYKGKKIVLLTHGPPFNTNLDKLEQGHVGSIDYRKFIERIQPKLAISGHLHETVGAVDKIGPTKLINPGWDGMVIELK